MSTPEHEVHILSVVQTENSTSGGFEQHYMYRWKNFLVFQNLDESEVIFFGMYVHEFVPQSVSSSVGHVYIQCLDSIPLYLILVFNLEMGKTKLDIRSKKLKPSK